MTDNVPPSPEDHDADLPDISKTSLRQILESDGNALVHSMQRVVKEREKRRQNYAAFGNSL